MDLDKAMWIYREIKDDTEIGKQFTQLEKDQAIKVLGDNLAPTITTTEFLNDLRSFEDRSMDCSIGVKTDYEPISLQKVKDNKRRDILLAKLRQTFQLNIQYLLYY